MSLSILLDLPSKLEKTQLSNLSIDLIKASDLVVSDIFHHHMQCDIHDWSKLLFNQLALPYRLEDDQTNRCINLFNTWQDMFTADKIFLRYFEVDIYGDINGNNPDI